MTDGPYVLEMTLRVQGYGTDKQAAQHAQRMREALMVVMGRFVNVTALNVERTRKDHHT